MLQKTNSVQPSGFWLVASAAVIWGTIGIATQAIYNLDNTNSLFLNLGRLLVATPILLVVCWRVVGRHMFQIRRRDAGIMALSGTFLAISQAAYFAAILHAGVTIPTLLSMCVSPLVVTVASVLLKLETLTQRKLISLICAILGSVLLVGLDALAATSGEQSGLLLGTLLSMVSAVGYGAMIICGRFLAGSYHPLQVNTVMFSAGSLVLLGANLAVGIDPVQHTQSWLLIVYLGLVPTALAYWLLQMGLRSVSATTASILSMLDPLVTAVLAWALFSELLAPISIVGAGLLLLSILLLAVSEEE
jgi:DME family drug/metabolite transporter